MEKGTQCFAVLAALALLALALPYPAGADLSAFVGTVGFAEDANLERSFGFGVRWGKSSGIIGGETSLLIARPGRELQISKDKVSKETATAFFYEARLLINIPAGKIKPFVGVGLGQIVVTSTEIPSSSDAAVSQALGAVADLQTNNAFSYGGGVRYALNEKLSLRADLRQYVVFSVTGIAKQQLAKELEQQTGVAVPTEDSTVQYNELSIGLSFKF